jgi:F0F1-type ATP synthase delta subunit
VYQPELIAGFRIEVAGQLFDNTVKTQMEKIANQLLS